MTEEEEDDQSDHDQSTGDTSSDSSDIRATLGRRRGVSAATVVAAIITGLGTAGGRGGGQGRGLDQSGTAPSSSHSVETVEGGGNSACGGTAVDDNLGTQSRGRHGGRERWNLSRDGDALKLGSCGWVNGVKHCGSIRSLQHSKR